MNGKQEMGTIIFVNNRMCVECISFCTKMCHNVRKRTGRKEIDNMNKIYDKVKECYKQVNEMTEFKPQIALVLGSKDFQFLQYRDIKEDLYLVT